MNGDYSTHVKKNADSDQIDSQGFSEIYSRLYSRDASEIYSLERRIFVNEHLKKPSFANEG